jgi:hypothetical protein
MADKKIKVKVDVETNAANSIADLKALKKQLKEVAVGSADFKKLSAEIRDVEDAIAGAKLGAEDFAGALEAAPGPVGQLFTGLKKVELATKSWGAALKATGIGLIVSLLGGFAAALSKSDETMKKFEPILIMFEQALNGILGALQPLIDGFIELAIDVMPYVTKAFKVVYSAVTAVFQSIGKLGSSIVKLFKGDFKGAWEDAKSSVTGFSDNYDTAVQRFEVGQKKMTKTQKENLKEQKKDLKEHTDETKKIREEELKELMDGQKEAMLELLSEREAEEFKVNEHYSRLLFLATKYGEDTTQLKAAQADALKEIDDKYLAKQAELDEKEKEKRLKDAEEFAKFSMEQYERIKELDEQRKDSAFKTNQAVSQSWVDLGNNISGIFGSLINVFAQGSAMAKAFGVAQVAINAASSIGQILVNARSAQFEYDKAIATGNAAILMSIPKLVNPITAPLGIAEAAAGKAAVAGGIAGKAALKVNTNLQIAAVGVSSAAQIAAILSSGKSKSSGAGGGGGSVASAGSGAIPNAPTIAGTAAPQITTTGGMNPTQQIGETISASQRPIRAYVISGDVTSQQALDRRTSRAATFSAG